LAGQGVRAVDRYTLYRVQFKEPIKNEVTGAWEWTTRTADNEEQARALLINVDRALDRRGALPAPQRVTAGGLSLRSGSYLEDSRQRSKSVQTVEQRESKMRATSSWPGEARWT
jgi:hypothetical protein